MGGFFLLCTSLIMYKSNTKEMSNINSYSSFRVRTTGYVEQFSNYNTARQSFDKLKRKKSKDGNFRIVLDARGKEGFWEVLDSITVKE